MKVHKRERDLSLTSSSSSTCKSSWLHLGSLHLIAFSSASSVYERSSPKSPWARKRRKHALRKEQWGNLFTEEGRLQGGGVKLLKKVRNGAIDPSIRAEVWPFLLGVYDLNSTRAERKAVKRQKRKEYEELRKQCQQIINHGNPGDKETKDIVEDVYSDGPRFIEGQSSLSFDRSATSSTDSISIEQGNQDDNIFEEKVQKVTPSNLTSIEEDNESAVTSLDTYAPEQFDDSSDCESSIEEHETVYSSTEDHIESSAQLSNIDSAKNEVAPLSQTAVDFFAWKRIIHLDAIRANADWTSYSPAQATVTYDKAQRHAISAGMNHYDHLEPGRLYHAARLVSILEAYTLYDPEIGYCQGMADLLSPILAVMDKDDEAFWCFVGFMAKARHNFRLDEVGIRRQLSIVSKIIKSKDSHLYRHLEKLHAEDCYFVYRMVVVVFRRELTFEQTLCLWEVIWADQAAIRAGIGKSAWKRVKMHVPPTDDLLLYAIAAFVLQKRKIVEQYSSMDEILRECNGVAGRLDVWKLLNDAHDLVMTLQDKIEEPHTSLSSLDVT